ncbi:unnamed protein product [Litomosoides sigmodontis]|uniref:Uncharacterized protein n=1 Tax=Litomosoides sigmodontis TaxID=42156 RepID=A0A3P6U292_LITSI|nr:unnamed protein product [Litomosoides sigmodontis]
MFEQTCLNYNRINRDRKRLTEFGDQVLNRSCSSLSRRTRDRIVTTIQRVHQRSRSAGNDNHFTLCSLPHKHRAPRGSMPFTRFSNYSGGGGSIGGDSCSTGGSSSGGGLLNPLKATKKFLKKIYDTATLPNRLHSKGLAATVTEQQNEIPTTSLLPVNSIFDANAANSSVTAVSYDFHSAPLSAPLKQATAIPDDSVNDSGLSRSISSSESQKTSSGDFRSWNDVFNHLKREMAYMRQRDAQIFADLHFVEVQLRNVKNQALSSNSGDCDNGRRVLDKRQVKLGDLVESMPL